MNKETKKNLKRFLPLSLCCIVPLLLLSAVPAISAYSASGALAEAFSSSYLNEIDLVVLRIKKVKIR